MTCSGPGCDSTPPTWLIDPFQITDFGRGTDDLEVFYLFTAAVAGKKATMIAAKVFELLAGCGHGGSPFERVRRMLGEGSLDDNLRRVRIGKYRLLGASYAAAATDRTLDLATATPDDLERLPGFGKKSSRFLILHSRPDARVAVIDTHMLKYLRAIGTRDVPDTIPTGADYLRLERVVLGEADRLGLAAADFDLKVWAWYASGKQGTPEFSSAPS